MSLHRKVWPRPWKQKISAESCGNAHVSASAQARGVEDKL